MYKKANPRADINPETRDKFWDQQEVCRGVWWCSCSSIPVNREYLVVKIFSDSLACAKIKCTKIHMQY